MRMVKPRKNMNIAELRRHLEYKRFFILSNRRALSAYLATAVVEAVGKSTWTKLDSLLRISKGEELYDLNKTGDGRWMVVIHAKYPDRVNQEVFGLFEIYTHMAGMREAVILTATPASYPYETHHSPDSAAPYLSIPSLLDRPLSLSEAVNDLSTCEKFQSTAGLREYIFTKIMQVLYHESNKDLGMDKTLSDRIRAWLYWECPEFSPLAYVKNEDSLFQIRMRNGSGGSLLFTVLDGTQEVFTIISHTKYGTNHKCHVVPEVDHGVAYFTNTHFKL